MTLSRALPLLLLLTIPAAPARAAEDGGDALPIPEQRIAYAWKDAQRIRYANTPLMRKAVDFIRARDYAAAEPLLREVLQNDPGNNHAHVFLAGVCNELGKWDEAVGLYADISARYPDYRDAALNQGLALYRLGRTDEAVAVYEKLLAGAPADFRQRREVVRQLAQWTYSLDRHEDARRYGVAWAGFQPDAVPLRFLTENSVRQGNWTDVVARCDQWLALESAGTNRGAILLQRGFALGHLGRMEQANKALTEAEGLITDRAQRLAITRQRGYNAVAGSLHEEASRHFKAYLLQEFDPALARAYLQALSDSGQWALARVEADQMLRRPDLPAELQEDILRTLLYGHQRAGDDPAVCATALRLHELTGRAVYLREAAASQERVGDWQGAVKSYRSYLQAEFDGATALNLHFLLKRNGRGAEAGELLERALVQPDLAPVLRQAALYELAQIDREAGREAVYFERMAELLRTQPAAKFYHEYAVQLYGAGRYEQAAEMFERSLEGEGDKAVRRSSCLSLADLHMALRAPLKAKAWLERARTEGAEGADWAIAMARADYQLEDFPACIERLLPLAGETDIASLYIGFAFYRMKMPGLALVNLNRVPDRARLSADERYNLHANRAYLHFDQEANAAALRDVERALNYRYDPALALVRVKTLVRLGDFAEALRTGDHLLALDQDAGVERIAAEMAARVKDPQLRAEILARVREPDPAFQSDVSLTMGIASFRAGAYEQAVAYLTRALQFDGRQADALYLRGLAWFRQQKFKQAEEDFLQFYRRADEAGAIPGAFWGDLGVLEGDLGDFDLGAAALTRAADLHPTDIDSREETAYQLMKANRSDEAQAQFAEAIKLYNQVTPYLAGAEAEEYRENRQALKKEYAKLDKDFGVQAYVAKTDYDDDIGTSLRTIDGALPAQAGLQGSWRPPGIGFRNEKTFDVFGRVLGSFEPDSWRLDEDSYQGGVGVVYKPLAAYNVNVSLERLFEIGDDSEANWLWRNMASWERGERPPKNRDWWWWTRAYGEVSYFLEEERRWITYLDGRAGPSLSLSGNVILTVPQLMAIGRWQSDDEDGEGTYAMLGLGANVRILEPERELVTERWYVDAYGYYVWGWFEEQPESFDTRDFEGVIFGVNLVK